MMIATRCNGRLPRLVALVCTSLVAVGAGAQAPARAQLTSFHEIAGTVTALNWSSSLVELQLFADDGSAWLVRTVPLAVLMERGVARHSLAAGTELRVAGHIEPGRTNVLRATNVLISPTREIVLEEGAARRWIGAPP